MGGILGLWLGGSMVSILETFDLLFFENIRSYIRCRLKFHKPAFLSNHKKPMINNNDIQGYQSKSNQIRLSDDDVYVTRRGESIYL